MRQRWTADRSQSLQTVSGGQSNPYTRGIHTASCGVNQTIRDSWWESQMASQSRWRLEAGWRLS